MVPSIGRVLLYHFNNVDDNGVTEHAMRPAVVMDVDRTTNMCVLHVLFAKRDGDRTAGSVDPFAHAVLSPQREYRLEPERTMVSPHFEGGEVGVIERRIPQVNTWSWPPRV
jgi:hypothetical protein